MSSFKMYPCIPEQMEFGSLGEGKTGEPRKKPLGARSKGENQEQTQPTYWC